MKRGFKGIRRKHFFILSSSPKSKTLSLSLSHHWGDRLIWNGSTNVHYLLLKTYCNGEIARVVAWHLIYDRKIFFVTPIRPVLSFSLPLSLSLSLPLPIPLSFLTSVRVAFAIAPTPSAPFARCLPFEDGRFFLVSRRSNGIRIRVSRASYSLL